MKRRSKIPNRKSKKMFSKHAMKTNSKNLRAASMRGGYRI